MAFSGLGAGTIGDPYQIDTIARFREMSSYGINDIAFIGSGLNDATATGTSYWDNAVSVFTITINGVNGIRTSTLNNGGSGYAINDTFTVDGGTAGLLATGKVLTVSGGVVLTYSILTFGSGYSVANGITTTATLGGGTGLIINITALQDTFKWKKDSGAETTVACLTTNQTLTSGVKVTFAARIGHTINDYWTITMASYYWKLMNNLDFSTQSGSLKGFTITGFLGKFDGQNYELQNITTYSDSQGFEPKEGSSVENITIRITATNGATDYNAIKSIFYDQNGLNFSRGNVTLSNIHVIVTGTGFINWFANQNFLATCTINNIVVEGNVQGMFIGAVRCLIEHIKVLRLTQIIPYCINYFSLVQELYSEMRYCQVVSPGITYTSTNGTYDANLSLLVGYMKATTSIIKQCFVQSNFTVNYYNTATTTYAHGLIGKCNGSVVVEVNDCYFKGNLSVNGGESAIQYDLGKSGYSVTPNTVSKVKRCLHIGDIITPLNNNRPVFTTNRVSGTDVSNNYYDSTKLTSITPVDYVGKQQGLTATQFLTSSNFTGFDFDTIWLAGGDNPELRNNPLYDFELIVRSNTITSMTRLSSTSLQVILDVGYVILPSWGVDVFNANGDLLFTSSNLLTNTFTLDALDAIYTIKAFFLDAGIKTYTDIDTYVHYSQDTAVLPLTTVAISSRSTLNYPYDWEYVHGSILVGNYIYGTTRGKPFTTVQGVLVKVPLSDISTYVEIPIQIEEGSTQPSWGAESICRCGNYLYFGFTSRMYVNEVLTDVNAFCQYNLISGTYKVFTGGRFFGGWVYTSDGNYLYGTFNTQTYKIDPTCYINATNQWNTNFANAETPYVMGQYDDTTQGGHILGGYPSSLKGTVHSAVIDEEYLYIAFSTNFEYSTEYAVSESELHKIRKSDMTAAGWCKIPKSTDDMSQTITHIFGGIEHITGVDPSACGYLWGSYAVRKSDMVILGLPQLHQSDTVPAQSYGSLIFGNYMIDIKVNKIAYVIDLSDANNWSPTEQIGRRLLKAYNYTWGGVALNLIPNEMLLSEAGDFFAFLWGSPSDIMKVDLPGLNYFKEPTIITMSAIKL
jgi:hypothetical protein